MVSPSNAGLDVGSADISADTASVSVNVIYNPSDPFSSGYQNVEFANLVKQNGVWKLTSMPYNYWDYSWYQTPVDVPGKP